MRAINPAKGETVWEWWTRAPIQAGVFWRLTADSSSRVRRTASWWF